MNGGFERSVLTPIATQVELPSTLDAAAVRDDRKLQKYPHEGRHPRIRFAAVVLLHAKPGGVVSQFHALRQRDDGQLHGGMRSGESLIW